MPKTKSPEKQVSTYLSEKDYKKFSDACAEEDRSMSSQLRLLIRAWMNCRTV